MSSRSIFRAASAAGVLLFAVACGSDTATQPDFSASPEELVAPPSGDAVELLINIASPSANTGNPPSFSLSSLPTTVEAGTTWSRTITVDPNHPFAPSVAVDYRDGGGPRSVSVNSPVLNYQTGQYEGDFSFTLSHKYTSAGTYTVRVAAETSGSEGGTRIESRTINVTPDLNLYIKNFEISSPVKAGWRADISFDAQGPGEELYSWTVDYDDNLTQQGFIPPGGSRTVNHTWKNPGTYTLVITISNGNRTATLTRQITVEETPISIEDYYVTPEVQEGEPIQYRFQVMGPGSGPYTAKITPRVAFGSGGETPVVRTVSPGTTVSGTLALESGLYAVEVEVSAEGLETTGAGILATVLRTPPSIVDLQVPETAHVGVEVPITFQAVDVTANAAYKAWAIAWKPAGTPDGAWGDNVLQELFEGNEHPVEARITFATPGDHEVLVLAGSEKNDLLLVDTVRSTITVTERPDVTCEAGSYKVGYECVAAPAGSFVPEAGAEEATLCPAGTFSATEGQAACEPAPAGSFVSEAGQTQATLCSVGTAQSLTGQTSCLPAPAGSYVNVTGAENATLCPAGTFSANAGQASCDPAPAGMFVSEAGQTQATKCAIGTYQSLTGQTSCLPAPAGSYVNVTGATQAVQCAPGTFQPDAGSFSCINAEPGSFVAVAGAVDDTQCVEGTFQPEAGQTSCIPAPVGSYVDVTGATSVSSCPAATTTVGTGATSASDCIPVGTVAVDRIDEAVRTGGLVAADGGKKGEKQLEEWVGGVKRSVDFLQGPQRQAGCVGVRNALAKADGEASPKDAVKGPARAATASDLRWVMTENGCSTGR